MALQPVIVFSKSWCPFCAKAKVGCDVQLLAVSSNSGGRILCSSFMAGGHGCVQVKEVSRIVGRQQEV